MFEHLVQEPLKYIIGEIEIEALRRQVITN